MPVFSNDGTTLTGFDGGTPYLQSGSTVTANVGGQIEINLSGATTEVGVRTYTVGSSVRLFSFDITVDSAATLAGSGDHTLLQIWDDSYADLLQIRFRAVNSGAGIQFFVMDVPAGYVETQIPDRIAKGTKVNLSIQITNSAILVRLAGRLAFRKSGYSYSAKNFGACHIGCFYGSIVTGKLLIDNVVADTVAAPTAASTDSTKLAAVWTQYKTDRLRADGCPIRNYPDGVDGAYAPWSDSTSETVSYFLQYAVQMNDQTTFDLVAGWAYANMRRGAQAIGSVPNLYSWHWDIQTATSYDTNSAHDADLDIAKAYYWAHGRWGSAGTINYLSRANAIAGDLATLVRGTGSSLYLPCDYAQAADTSFEVNPSYYDLVALKLMEKYDTANAATWTKVITGTLDIMAAARDYVYAGQSSSAKLPPDWGSWNPATTTWSAGGRTNPNRYAYEAFRVFFRALTYAIAYDAPTMATLWTTAKTFFASEWTTNSQIKAEYNHDGSVAGNYEKSIFTYAAQQALRLNDGANATAAAIYTSKLAGLYAATVEGHIYQDSPSSGVGSYYDQSWLLFAEMQRQGSFVNYATVTTSPSITKSMGYGIRLVPGIGTVATKANANSIPAYNAGSGSNRILIITFSMAYANSNVITAVTYGGQALTRGVQQADPYNYNRAEVWYLINPPSGSNTVSVTSGDNTVLCLVIATFTNVSGIGSTGTGSADSTAASASLTPQKTGSMIVAAASSGTANNNLTAGSGTTRAGVINSGSSAVAMMYKPTTSTSSHTINATVPNDGWSMAALELKPVPTTAPAVISKTLTYAVRLTPSAITKTLAYAVSGANAVSITRAMAYSVKTSPSAITKALIYRVRTAPTAITKSMTYLVRKNAVLTKSLAYVVKSSPSLTKALVYRVTTSPAGITKALAYAVTQTTAKQVTKALTYTIKATPGALTKSLAYTVRRTPAGITKALAYKIRLPGATITKLLGYEVVRPIADLVDSFDSLRGDIWQAVVTGGGTVTFVAGRLVLTPSATGTSSAKLESRGLYNLATGQVTVKVVTLTGTGAVATWLRLDQSTHTVSLRKQGADLIVAVDSDTATVTYPSDTRYWRIITQAGVITFQVSADGEAWSSVYVTNAAFSMTAMRVSLYAATTGTVSSPGAAVLDNINQAIVVQTARVFWQTPAEDLATVWTKEPEIDGQAWTQEPEIDGPTWSTPDALNP